MKSIESVFLSELEKLDESPAHPFVKYGLMSLEDIEGLGLGLGYLFYPNRGRLNVLHSNCLFWMTNKEVMTLFIYDHIL